MIVSFLHDLPFASETPVLWLAADSSFFCIKAIGSQRGFFLALQYSGDSFFCSILVHVKVIRTQVQSSLHHHNPCNTKRRHSWLESPSSFMNEALSKDQQGRREHGRHLASSSEAMWIDASSLLLFTWNWVMAYRSYSWDNFCSNRSVRIFFPLSSSDMEAVILSFVYGRHKQALRIFKEEHTTWWNPKCEESWSLWSWQLLCMMKMTVCNRICYCCWRVMVVWVCHFLYS